MKLINRDIYLDKIKPFIGNSLIKVLVGMRRVGKSYLLRQIIELIKNNYLQNNIIYINKEDYAFDSIKNYSDLINYVEEYSISNNPKAIFIDEIQEIEQFEKALRHFQTKSSYDIYCTGSNSKLLSGELSSLLSGRYVQINVHPLIYSEYLLFNNLENSNQNFINYMKKGGLPHLVNLPSDNEIVREYHRNIFDSIILRDIVLRYKIRNIGFIGDLSTYLADNIGSLISAKKISDYLKSQNVSIPNKTMIEYLSYLESTFFVEKVRRYDIIGKKIFEINDKYFFQDIGLRNYLIPFNQRDFGKILENVIFNHLLAFGYKVMVGNINNLEIDFVAEKNGVITYIQVAYLIIDEKTHQREFGNLLKIQDNWRKIVVSMDEMADGFYQGIEHWEIKKFLLEFR